MSVSHSINVQKFIDQYICNNIREYYDSQIVVVPYGYNNIGYDYVEFSLNLILRYLPPKFEHNLVLPDGFLLNRRYGKLRKKIFNNYYCAKISRIPSHIDMRINRRINILSSILTIKHRTQPKIRLDSFQLLAFTKIISSDLFESIDYDVYLMIIEHLKTVFEEQVIECSKLQLIDDRVSETHKKKIYLKPSSFDRYHSIIHLIESNSLNTFD